MKTFTKQKELRLAALLLVVAALGVATYFNFATPNKYQKSAEVYPLPPSKEHWEENEELNDEQTEEAHIEALNKSKIWDEKAMMAKQLRTVGANRSITGTWSERGCRFLSGRVVAADIRTNSSNRIYSASGSGAIYKCDANGTNFYHINKKFSFNGVRMLRHVIGTNRIVVVDNYTARYTDNDADWTQSNLPDMAVKKAIMVNVTGTNKPILILGKSYQENAMVIYRSDDNGITYTQKLTIPNSTIADYTEDYKKDYYDIWTSYDNTVTNSKVFLVQGKKFFEYNLSNNTLINKTDLPYSAAAQGERFLITGNVNGSTTKLYIGRVSGDSTTFYSSTNGASTWQTKGSYNNTPFGINSFSCGLGSNGDILYLGYQSWAKSTNGAASFSEISNWKDYYAPINNKENNTTLPIKIHGDLPGVFCQKLSNGNEVQLICTDGGFYYSTNQGATVIPYSEKDNSNRGHHISEVYSTYTNPNDHNYVLIGTQDQGIQRNDSYFRLPGLRYHEQFYGGDWATLAGTKAPNNYAIWATCGGCGGAWYANDARLVPRLKSPYNSYDATTNPNGFHFSSGGASTNRFFTVIVASPTDPKTAYIAVPTSNGDRIKKLTYNSSLKTIQTISECTTNFTELSGSTSAYISAMAISEVNNSYKYVLMNNGAFFYSTNANSDWNGTWTKTANFTGPTFGGQAGINSISPSKNPALLREVYISGGGDYNVYPVYFSDTNGQSFVNISNNNGLPRTTASEVEQTYNGQFVFAATEVGPYVYVKADQRWYDLSTDGTTYEAPQIPYKSLEIIPSLSSNVDELNTVRFSTYGRGVWDFKINSSVNINSRIAGSDSLVEEEEILTETPKGWSLYPNPTSDKATMQFSLQQEEELSFAVYDMQGKVVKTIAAKLYKESEQHSVTLNLSDLPKGVYILRGRSASGRWSTTERVGKD
jgi:hypothetical protein